MRAIRIQTHPSGGMELLMLEDEKVIFRWHVKKLYAIDMIYFNNWLDGKEIAERKQE